MLAARAGEEPPADERQRFRALCFHLGENDPGKKWDAARATDVLNTIEKVTFEANEAGAPDFVQRGLEGPVKARSLAQRPEVRVGFQDLVARVLDEREELGARERLAPGRREGRAGDAVREREDGRGPEVQVRAAGTRECVEDLLADGEGRDEEDLLVHGVRRAEVRQPREEPVAFDGGCHARSLNGPRPV